MSRNVLNSCCQMEIPFEYLDVEKHPTPKDLERNMSKELVAVYLKTCTSIERSLFGRDKALQGPAGDLWINPEDRAQGKKLKLTPLRTEELKALTHKGVLELGKQVEGKMEKHNRKMTEKAVAEAEELAK